MNGKSCHIHNKYPVSVENGNCECDGGGGLDWVSQKRWVSSFISLNWIKQRNHGYGYVQSTHTHLNLFEWVKNFELYDDDDDEMYFSEWRFHNN